MLDLGTEAPYFRLPDTKTGQEVSLDDIASDVGTVIMFICNHCPYVIHVNPEIVKLSQEYSERGISFVGISSNDVENYPQDGPAEMKKLAEAVGYSFPYLYDESQNVAKDYDAACTPDFYLFDGDRRLVYRGQLDGSRPGGTTPLTGEDLRAALDAMLNNDPIDPQQRPSAGCNIKWKKTI